MEEDDNSEGVIGDNFKADAYRLVTLTSGHHVIR